MSMSPAIALVPYLGTVDDGLNPWLRLQPSERRRLAMQAARERDTAALWGLTEAWLHADPRHRTVAASTTKNYRTGLRHLLDAWRQEDLLRSGRNPRRARANTPHPSTSSDRPRRGHTARRRRSHARYRRRWRRLRS